MATKFVNNRVSGKKKASLPSRMASRNVEVRAVGAWVEPEPYFGEQYQEAVISAQYEEAKINRIQEEKEAKLKEFQEGVKKRVQMLQKIKRQQMLEKSCRAVEVERNVLNQSAKAAEKSTPRKNRCVLRDDSNHGIRRSVSAGANERVIDDEVNARFQSHSNQVREISSQARRKLTSHKVMAEPFAHTSLPGGSWDHKESFSSRVTESPCATDDDEHQESLTADEEHVQAVAAANGVPLKTVHFNLENLEEVLEEIEEDQGPHESVSPAPLVVSVSNAPHVSSIHHVSSVPRIYPGVEDEEDKQLAVKQRAMYRRLFMDIEREQVKENLRRQEHRKKINRIKKEKEAERVHAEQASLSLSIPRDPVTGETVDEILAREQREEKQARREQEERRERVQRGREGQRFVEALKHQLREKVVAQQLDLPALCCCGLTVWDTSPDTCANNCVFYKNPKAYARALQSLLASCQVV